MTAGASLCASVLCSISFLNGKGISENPGVTTGFHRCSLPEENAVPLSTSRDLDC